MTHAESIDLARFNACALRDMASAMVLALAGPHATSRQFAVMIRARLDRIDALLAPVNKPVNVVNK